MPESKVTYKQLQAEPLEYYFAKYRELDPVEAAKRTGLEYDPEQNRFTFDALGHTIYAKWPELVLTPADSDSCPKDLYAFTMQIIAMRFLISGAAMPSGGVFKAYRDLPWGEVYDENFQGRCIKRFAYGFGYKPDAFRKAAGSLGGITLEQGDASYDLPFLGGVTCRFILWTPDEEFPPSAQILFSDNIRFAFNAEDLAAIGDIVIGALKEKSK